MRPVDTDARELGLRLGLGDLNASTPCHGWQCGCVCLECSERRGRVSPAFQRWLERDNDAERVPALFVAREEVRQPWEVAA